MSEYLIIYNCVKPRVNPSTVSNLFFEDLIKTNYRSAKITRYNPQHLGVKGVLYAIKERFKANLSDLNGLIVRGLNAEEEEAECVCTLFKLTYEHVNKIVIIDWGLINTSPDYSRLKETQNQLVVVQQEYKKLADIVKDAVAQVNPKYTNLLFSNKKGGFNAKLIKSPDVDTIVTHYNIKLQNLFTQMNDVRKQIKVERAKIIQFEQQAITKALKWE